MRLSPFNSYSPIHPTEQTNDRRNILYGQAVPGPKKVENKDILQNFIKIITQKVFKSLFICTNLSRL